MAGLISDSILLLSFKVNFNVARYLNAKFKEKNACSLLMHRSFFGKLQYNNGHIITCQDL
jgi:hypothetical protein